MKEVKKTRKERMEDDWYDALNKFGKDEAVHICSEKWGYSIYKTTREIDKIEEDAWL